MYDKRCDLGILLVEDATEEIKGYIRYLNEKHADKYLCVACRRL